MNSISWWIKLLLFCAVWGWGGWLISRSAFFTSRHEQLPVGLIVGFTLNILFANMLAQLIPVQAAFWAAAFLVLLLGLAFSWKIGWKQLASFPFLPGQWLLLVGLTGIFTLAERGLAVFDDYAHLPTLSMIAAGDIPPQFPLNAGVSYNYHYFLMVFSAQLTRIAGLEIWKSLDISRALVFAITILLAGSWVRRLARSQTAGLVGALFLALGMGTRWILLLFPASLINWISRSVTLIGSGAGSGSSLADTLTRPWAVEGFGPLAFPFAFANGIFTPAVLGISGANSTSNTALLIFFLLTFNRWRGWRGAVITTLMTAALALITEFGIALGFASWAIVVFLYAVQQKTFRLPRSMWQWLVVIGSGSLLGAFQGGAFIDIVGGWISQLQGKDVISYQTVGFAFSLKPVLVSSHLGVLSLTSLSQLIVAMCEVGPVLFVIPLLAVWGIKAYRCGRWYEAVLILSGFLSIAAVFLQYTGSAGVRNTSRLYTIINLCAVYAVPLTWVWVSHRSERLRLAAGLLGAVVMFGGAVILSVKLGAIQRPVYSYFLTALDARMYDAYWDRLEPAAVVFDPEPSRGPTVFGRPGLGFNTWFEAAPQWAELYQNPDPRNLRTAGFSYAYIDNHYWQEIGPAGQNGLSDPCVKLVKEFADEPDKFRRLLNIEACKE